MNMFISDVISHGMFTLDIFVCVYISVQHYININCQELVQTHSLHLGVCISVDTK